MQFRTLLNYGLRMVFFLAINGGVCSSHEISKEINVPRDYLVQIAQLLRKGGIIEARPGKNGGYKLLKDPSEISLYEVISLLEEDTRSTSTSASARAKGSANKQTTVMKNIQNALDSVALSHDAYLNTITIQMILDGKYDASNLGLSGNASLDDNPGIKEVEVGLQGAVAYAEANSVRGIQSKSPAADVSWKREHDDIIMQEEE